MDMAKANAMEQCLLAGCLLAVWNAVLLGMPRRYAMMPQGDEDFNVAHYVLGLPMTIVEVAEKAEYSKRRRTADLMLTEPERPGS
jgi:hypothetical protein